jgi:hypothetical protein
MVNTVVSLLDLGNKNQPNTQCTLTQPFEYYKYPEHTQTGLLHLQWSSNQDCTGFALLCLGSSSQQNKGFEELNCTGNIFQQ